MWGTLVYEGHAIYVHGGYDGLWMKVMVSEGRAGLGVVKVYEGICDSRRQKVPCVIDSNAKTFQCEIMFQSSQILKL